MTMRSAPRVSFRPPALVPSPGASHRNEKPMTHMQLPMSAIESDSQLDVPRRGRRWSGVAVVAVLSLATLSACGSDSESSEDAFCDAGDSLRADVEGIADIDVVSGGTDAVTDQIDAIQSDVAQLSESGLDVAADEISALETAVDDVSSELQGLGDDISVENAQAVSSSIGSVVTAAGAVYERLDTVCS